MSTKKAVTEHLGSAKSSKEAKKPKHHVHRMSIERADGGGHIVHHHLKDEDGNDGPTQTHVVADNDALAENVQGAMGDQPPAGEGQPQAPAPQEPGQDPGAMGQ